MREKDIMDKMQSEVVIPEVVQERAELAFEKIRKKERKVIKMRSKKRRWKAMWIAVAAAVFALGTMTVCAAYLHWSKGLEAEFNATDEQKQLLEEEQYTAPLYNEDGNNGDSSSVTAQGVTITAQQSIVDRHFAWLSFRIEGYELEEGEEPCFEYTAITVDSDAEASISYYGGFYNGIHRNDEGRPVYEDGSPAEEERFVNDDGSMEYTVMIDATEYGEYDGEGLIGKNIKVEFGNLGTVYKAAYSPKLEAVWDFDFELKGSGDVKSLTLSEPLGDTGAVVMYAEISPISLYVNYDFPLRKEVLEGVNEKGEPVTSTTFADAPALTGVRLKDGTLLTGIINGGTTGYLDSEHIYRASFAIDRILDTEQVDALLFIKGEGELTEENLYIVPIE